MRTAEEKKRLAIAGITAVLLVGLVVYAAFLRHPAETVDLAQAVAASSNADGGGGCPIPTEGYEVMGADDDKGVYGLWSDRTVSEALQDIDGRFVAQGYVREGELSQGVNTYGLPGEEHNDVMFVYAVAQNEGSTVIVEVLHG